MCKKMIPSLLAISMMLSLTPLAQSNDYFGGLMTSVQLDTLDHHGLKNDGRLLYIGGGGGSRLGKTPWLIGGRGMSASLIDSTYETELHLRYGGMSLIYTIPLEPFIVGLESFVGGGSYSLFLKTDDFYVHHQESFMVIEPKAHFYYPFTGNMIVDINVGYLITTTKQLKPSGLSLGLSILFGRF